MHSYIKEYKYSIEEKIDLLEHINRLNEINNIYDCKIMKKECKDKAIKMIRSYNEFNRVNKSTLLITNENMKFKIIWIILKNKFINIIKSVIRN